MAVKKAKVAPLSLLVDGRPLSGVIRIRGDGVKFAELTIVSPKNKNAAWSIVTFSGLMPFDNSEGNLDEDGRAVVYLGPTREKGDADFKVAVKKLRLGASVRFF